MNRGIKWFLIGLGGLTVLLVAAVVLITLMVDVNKYKPVIEQKVAQQTGRPFSIGGKLGFSLIPTTAISFSKLTLGNPEGFENPTFIGIEAFEARIKFWPFLLSGFKDIQVERFVLKKPRFELIRDQNGRTNWEGIGQKSAQAPQEASEAPEKPAGETSAALPFAIAVNEFAVSDGTLIWEDQAAKQRYAVTDIDLVLEDVSLDRPIGIDFSARVDEKPIALSGNIGPVGRKVGKEPIGLNLTLSALKQLNLKLSGQVAEIMKNPSYDVHIELEPFSPRKTAELAGRPLDLPATDSKTLTRVSLKSRISGTPSTFSLSDGHLVLDDSNITFSAESKDIKRPDLSFNVNVDRIDVDRYLPPPAKEDPASQDKASRKPAPSSKEDEGDTLKRLRLDGRLKIGQLTAKGLKTSNIRVHVKAANGVFNIDPAALDLYGGNVTSRGRLNLATETPQVRLALTSSAVSLNPLIRDLKQKDVIEGALFGDISLQLTGGGADIVKKTLTGNGNVQIKDGALKGIDLLAMVRNEDGAYGLTGLASGNVRTRFTQIQMPFTIVRGVFKTIDTRLFSELLRVSAKGTADLTEETLNFRIEPTAVTTASKKAKKIKRSEVTVPVIVSGTFGDPKYRPDLSRAAQKVIEKEVLESKEVQKALEKNPELKVLEEPARDLLKGILNQ